MQGSLVNLFNKKFLEKTVNRLSLVVLDVECIKNNIVKELGVNKDGQTVVYSFLPPKKFKPTSQSCWFTKNLQGINWSSGFENYTELEKSRRNHKLLIWITMFALEFSFDIQR